jgi:hypothetical protein
MPCYPMLLPRKCFREEISKKMADYSGILAADTSDDLVAQRNTLSVPIC